MWKGTAKEHKTEKSKLGVRLNYRNCQEENRRQSQERQRSQEGT